MNELSIDNFKTEVSVTYKSEQYLVRDNGAICRIHRPDKGKRKLDGVWTFGRQCKTNGYRRITGIVVHKIVATAFHGEQPTPSHVVDHVDTNRINNRVENLRWVTRLDNITNNIKTLRRIEQKWGSVERMLKDPNRADKVEAWCNMPWIHQEEENVSRKLDSESFTPIATQRNWKTPNAFPLCPEKITPEPLRTYYEQLQTESIISHNKYGECLVEIAALSDDENFLSVVTRICDGVKGWGLLKITFEEGKYVHEALGSYFTPEGAEKKHYGLLGIKWDKGETFDDLC